MTSDTHPYILERAQIDITLRMLKLNARTKTICLYTGLKGDRVRRIGLAYGGVVALQKRTAYRGKPANLRQIYTQSPEAQLQATTLMSLLRFFCLHQLPLQTVEEQLQFGRKLCQAHETYLQFYPNPLFSLEHTWVLLNHLDNEQHICTHTCHKCSTQFITDVDLLSADCPTCYFYATDA